MRAPEFWHHPPGLAATLLSPLEKVWKAGSWVRRQRARPYRASIPIVCVGNLVAGGSGKTPVVLSLARRLIDAGQSVHIVTRGYGGRLAGPGRVELLTHDAVAVGDEALLLAEVAPCWVARDRAAGMAAATRAGATLVLLDDGFQNPDVTPDCAILVVDSAYAFGNRHLIPAGPLREPIMAGLARADAMVLLGDAPAPIELRGTARPMFRACLTPTQPMTSKRPYLAFAGLGRPQKFFDTLREAGVSILAAHAFGDHHVYRPAEIATLRQEAARAGATLITTAKDWVRLPPALRVGIDKLDVEIRWRDDPAITQFVLDAIQPRTHEDRRRSRAG